MDSRWDAAFRYCSCRHSCLTKASTVRLHTTNPAGGANKTLPITPKAEKVDQELSKETEPFIFLANIDPICWHGHKMTVTLSAADIYPLAYIHFALTKCSKTNPSADPESCSECVNRDNKEKAYFPPTLASLPPSGSHNQIYVKSNASPHIQNLIIKPCHM